MSEIDVSKCRYNYTSITDDSCCYAESERHVIMRKCEDFPNCYYRQLQQLKQENEELKEKINENNYCYNELLKLKDFFFNKSKTFYKCLDEIEGIIEECNANSGCYDTCNYYDLCNCDTDSFVLKLIKQAKKSEEA